MEGDNNGDNNGDHNGDNNGNESHSLQASSDRNVATATDYRCWARQWQQDKRSTENYNKAINND